VRVGLDAQLAQGTATGIGEYVAGLAQALREAGVDLVLLSERRLDPWRFDRRVLWDQLVLPLAARQARVDVLHCASGTMPLLLPAPAVVTVHDLAWLRVQSHTRAYARAYFGRFSLARYAHARRIAVDSSFSRDELLALAPHLDAARVEVIYPGVARDVTLVARARDDEAPFVLAVGTVEPRKNLALLVRAIAPLPGVRLISAGPLTPYRDACLALARELGVAERVVFLGYVPREAVLALYARAAVAAVPSRYEGFGYGAAQALCAGVPLVAAAAASLPEVVAGAAPLLGPDDVTGWSDALRAVLDARDAAEARAAGLRAASIERFGWPASARRFARLYASVDG
jgi:glycosyltransferase involved in cell wall biosynthesis